LDNLGGQTNGTPGVPDVLLTSQYDADGNRIGLSASINSTADFQNRRCGRPRKHKASDANA
jgi:hypothetical protein